jgi:hypothetical protein
VAYNNNNNNNSNTIIIIKFQISKIIELFFGNVEFLKRFLFFFFLKIFRFKEFFYKGGKINPQKTFWWKTHRKELLACFSFFSQKENNYLAPPIPHYIYLFIFENVGKLASKFLF